MNKKYLNPEDFRKTFIEWCRQGKPEGNSKLYLQIWDGVVNAVKADIGKMQKVYDINITHYEDKVLDSTIKVLAKLKTLTEETAPINIVTLAWLYTYGVVFGPKAIQEDFEDEMASLDAPSEGGDDFIDVIEVDSNY